MTPERPNEAPETLFAVAESLREKYPDTPSLVLAVGRFIFEHARQVSSEQRAQPKSMLESRFTSAQDAFEKGMMSCGSVASISAEMLRHLGLEVKLIHGETDQSVDHAWISVLNPETGVWEEYDLMQKDGAITPQHIKKAEAGSWEEIRGQIEEDNRTRKERQKKLGIE